MNYAVNIIATIILIPWPAMVIMSPMMIAARGFSNDKTSIITALLFFSYPIIVFLLIKIFGFKFYGTEPLSWLLGFSVVALIIIQLYGLPRMLYNIYNDISNEGYHITTDKVYKDGIPLKDADPDTFTAIEGTLFYSKDAKHVYADHKVIENAHAPSFGVVEGSNGLYYRDKKNAYTQWGIINNSDGDSFEFVGHNYAKDQNHVYFDSYILNDADPESFKALESFVGLDSQFVFVRQYKAKSIEDLGTFQLIYFEDEFFIRNQDHVYGIFYNSSNSLEVFPSADPSSFKAIGNYYAVDKEHVYHYGYHRGHVKVLSGVNPDNFVLEHDPATGANARAGDLLFRNGDVVSLEDEH